MQSPDVHGIQFRGFAELTVIYFIIHRVLSTAVVVGLRQQAADNNSSPVLFQMKALIEPTSPKLAQFLQRS
jgi:hypothetical protein